MAAEVINLWVFLAVSWGIAAPIIAFAAGRVVGTVEQIHECETHGLLGNMPK